MASFNKFNPFVEALAEKVHNLGSDTLKVMLSNTAPSASNAVKADITEISAGNGYTAVAIPPVLAAARKPAAPTNWYWLILQLGPQAVVRLVRCVMPSFTTTPPPTMN